MVNYLALATSLLLTSVAAYYSIIGLTTIFAAAFWPVVIMGISLELGKIVSASWAYRNWNTAPATIKYYLIVAIFILSFITSLGIFGFLSKAHSTVSSVSNEYQIKLSVIDRQLEVEKQRLKTLLDQEQKYTGPVRRFEKSIDETQNKIIELNNKRLPLLQDQNKVESEVGPLKYVAEIIYDKSDSTTLEKAVRGIIIVIVLVFDPLAIILLIAANHGMTGENKQKTKQLINERSSSKIEIDKAAIKNLDREVL